MEIIWTIIKFLLANILVITLSSTLIGFFLRGLLQPRTENPYGKHKAEWYHISPTQGLVYSFISGCLTLILIVLLIRETNYFVLLGFLTWMLTRIKDLLLEIKTGKKTTKRTMTTDSIDIALSIIAWTGIFIFNYGLYLMWIK